MPVQMDFVSKLTQLMYRFSFSHFGCAPLTTPVSLSLYQDWLREGHHGSMDYLEKHLPFKEDPRLFAPKARSAIMVAKNYFPHPFTAEKPLAPRTALYALGEDYHFAFKKELQDLAAALQVDYPSEEFLCFTDSAPILERDLAAQAGLGWIGKNSCLIHPKKGSLFFIGEILTSLSLAAPATKIPDFCGTCDRCIRACPTQALEAPRVLNARKCISYWTIEAKEDAPLELREKIGSWFFGCDICQTVCPWNEKVFGKETMAALTAEPKTSREDLIADLRWLLSSSNKTLGKAFASMPYDRARAHGLKRNALYVIGNLGLSELRAEAEAVLTNERLSEVAHWALSRLDASTVAPDGA